MQTHYHKKGKGGGGPERRLQSLGKTCVLYKPGGGFYSCWLRFGVEEKKGERSNLICQPCTKGRRGYAVSSKRREKGRVLGRLIDVTIPERKEKSHFIRERRGMIPRSKERGGGKHEMVGKKPPSSEGGERGGRARVSEQMGATFSVLEK